MSDDRKYHYDARQREAKVFENRMGLTSYKGKAVEYLVRAEGAGDSEMGKYFASIAQAYATLELARVNAIQANATRNNRSNK